MVAYLGSLVQLCCGWGRNAGNKYHWRVWGALAVSRSHRVCPRSWPVCLPVYTAQAPGCSAGELSKAGPGLCASLNHSGSGSQVLHKGTDLVGPVFRALPRCERLRQQVLGKRAHTPSWVVRLITSPIPAPWFPGCAGRALPQVCYVSPLGS